MASSLKYCVFRARFDRLVNGVKPAVGKVARKAFERNLITAQNLSAAEYPLIDQEYRTSQLLQQILSKVEHNPAHFDTFIAILESVPVLYELAEELTAELSNQEGSDVDVTVSCMVNKVYSTDSSVMATGSSRDLEDTAIIGELINYLTVFHIHWHTHAHDTP